VTRGFSIIELIMALILLQMGVLATAGLILLAQRNLVRAELTLRGVVESRWVADSLARAGATGSGGRVMDWGELAWSPASDPIPALRVSAWSPLLRDTLVSLFALPPLTTSISTWPDSVTAEERW
jgi:hypothetical protein